MERLHDLLMDWEDRKAAGESVSAETLCPDDPMLARQLAEKIRLLQSFDSLISDPTEEPPIPRMIGKYEIRGMLGRGGMGVVYLAFDPALRRTVAIKSLNDVTFDSKRLRERFTREGQLLASLEHDHIVGVYEAGMSEGKPYLVMEYFPAGSLANHRSRFLHAGPEAVTDLMEKIAGAVQYAHEAGVLHRDLKPANILLDAADEPMVCDFGLAKLIANDLDVSTDDERSTPTNNRQSDLTGQSNRPGTLPYMAPEQLDTQVGKADVKSDVWALGVIYFELLTGRRPFDADTWFADAKKERRPVWTAAERKRISSAIRHIVEKCLSINPDLRYDNASSLLLELVKLRKKKQYLRWAGIAVFMTVVLGTAAVVGYNETRPERTYERAVKPMLAALSKGELVDLIPEKGLPPFIIREGQAHTTVKRTDEGLEIESPFIGIVEFLPDIPSQNFLINAEIRHDATIHNRDRPRIGIVSSNFRLENSFGRQNFMRVATLDSLRNPNEIIVEYSSSWILKSENERFAESRMRQPAAVTSVPSTQNPGSEWANISITTTEDKSRASAQIKDFSVGPLKCDNEIYHSHCKRLHDEQAAAKGINYPISPKSSVSIFVLGSKCTIRQISVQAFD